MPTLADLAVSLNLDFVIFIFHVNVLMSLISYQVIVDLSGPEMVQLFEIVSYINEAALVDVSLSTLSKHWIVASPIPDDLVLDNDL